MESNMDAHSAEVTPIQRLLQQADLYRMMADDLRAEAARAVYEEKHGPLKQISAASTAHG